MMLLRDKAATTTMFTPFAFFLLFRRVDRYIRLLSKPIGKIATTSFNQRKWTSASLYSSLCKETKKFLLIGFFSKNNHSIVNHGTCQWWQLLRAAKCALKQTWSTIVMVMTLRNFPFLEKQGIHFFKDDYSFSIFLGPHPLPSQVLLRLLSVLPQFYLCIEQIELNVELLFASKWCKWTPFNPLSIQWYLLNIVSSFWCIRSVKISLRKWYIGALCAVLVWWKVSNY